MVNKMRGSTSFKVSIASFPASHDETLTNLADDII
jgi:hypothetical protein